MKKLKMIAEQIRDELDVAEEYAVEAVRLKSINSGDASSYAEMAKDELDHAEKLHKMAVRAIEKKTESGATVPVGMEAVWEWEHERMIDRLGKIKALLEMA